MTKKVESKKAPSPIDMEVGRRIRQKRIEMGMSQEALGETLGLTFQQVQKYEKGTNRIAPSRLVVVANALKTPVSFFFEKVGHDFDPTNDQEARADFLATSEGAALIRVMAKLKPEVVRGFVRLAERFVEYGA